MKFYEFRKAAKNCARHARQRDQLVKQKHLRAKQQAAELEAKRGRAAALENPYLDIPADMTYSDEYVQDIQHKRRYNDAYSEYFARMADEYNKPTLFNVADNVRNCHRLFFGEWYGMQRVFDVKSVSLCHNKFCSNCMHIQQASRLKRFTPVLAELRKEYDLYHLVETVPNCSAEKLENTIDRLFSSHTRIMRYFSGDAKLRGVDFKQYGFAGAVRFLECTVKPTEYHPHIHSILLLKKDLPLYKTLTNAYSFSNGVFSRKFSDLEILLQRVLYLLMNGETVRAAVIDAVPTGYSCTLDAIEGEEWHEAFKYVTKLTKEDGGREILDYEQFVPLYFALKGRRVMQGYGKLYRLGLDDSDDTEVRAEYARIRETLRLVEVPIELKYDLDELVVDLQKGRFKVISKYAIQRYLNELSKKAGEATE